MTLDEAKALLDHHQIPYDCAHFETEAAYRSNRMRFPFLENAKPCQVVVLVIQSKQGRKNLELQCNCEGGVFTLVELYFGEYCYDLLEDEEEVSLDDLPAVLLATIRKAMEGRTAVLVANDLTKQRWAGDWCFDLNMDDPTFGKEAYEAARREITKPKRLWKKLFGSKMQYEVYSWEHYECIVN